MQPSWFYSWTTLYLTNLNKHVLMSCELFIMRMKKQCFCWFAELYIKIICVHW